VADDCYASWDRIKENKGDGGGQKTRPPPSDKEKAERRKKARCFRCEETGHYANECTNPPKLRTDGKAGNKTPRKDTSATAKRMSLLAEETEEFQQDEELLKTEADFEGTGLRTHVCWRVTRSLPSLTEEPLIRSWRESGSILTGSRSLRRLE